jgi:hypothetical protein
MNANIVIWLFFRLVRWLGWIVFLGWSAYFWWDNTPHLNQFNHLLAYCEVIWFSSAITAMFAGFLELMMRERAGIVRPELGQLIPPSGESALKAR